MIKTRTELEWTLRPVRVEVCNELNKSGLEEIRGLIYVHGGNAYALMEGKGHEGHFLISTAVLADGEISLALNDWTEVDVPDAEVNRHLCSVTNDQGY